MQQYLMTVPETKHANFLLNYIIQTGYFERVDKIGEEQLEEKFLLDEMLKAKEGGIANNNDVLKKLGI